MKKFSLKKQLLTSAVLMLFAAGTVYYAGSGYADSSTPEVAAAMPVVVKTVTQEDVRLWSEFSGRLIAVDSAQIRPEVSGRITELRFEDGQQVKAGEVLLVIEPRPYQAAVSKAEANLATAKTNAEFAKTEENRASGMIKSQAIAQRLYDERANANRIAAATVKSAQAELLQAQIDLEHAYVRAPISGRVSRAEITVGNLVQAGAGAPLLTTIVSNDALYADFEVDEQTYIKSIRANASGSDQEKVIPVELSLQGDKSHTYPGTVYSFDNHLDVTSGTIRARAKFQNTDGALMPGMFVSVNLASSSQNKEFLVPERAIGSDQSKKFVYVVDNTGKVSYREIVLGKNVKSQRVVLTGLADGDRVIIDGTQHIRPDMMVAPREAATEELTLAKR